MGNQINHINIGNTIETTKLHDYYVGVISEHYLNIYSTTATGQPLLFVVARDKF